MRIDQKISFVITALWGILTIRVASNSLITHFHMPQLLSYTLASIFVAILYFTSLAYAISQVKKKKNIKEG